MRRLTIGILGAGVLALAVAGCGSSSGGADESGTPASTAKPAASSTTAPAPSTTTAPAGPIFTQTGSGTANTANFRVPDDWDLAWTYDCSNFLGGQGNFIVTIYDNDDGQQLDFDNQGVNQLGPGGQGTEHYHSGGNQKFLKIASECNWAVTVTKA